MQFFRLACSFFLCMGGIIIALSLISYSSPDASCMHTSLVGANFSNWCGFFGAQLAAVLLFFLGCASFVLTPLCITAAHAVYKKRAWYIPVSAFIVLTCACATIGSAYAYEWYAGVIPGGYVGTALYSFLVARCEPPITFLVLFAIIWSSLVLICGFAWVKPVIKWALVLRNRLALVPWWVTIQLLLSNLRNILMRNKLVDKYFGLLKKNKTFFEPGVFDAFFWKKYAISSPEEKLETIVQSAFFESACIKKSSIADTVTVDPSGKTYNKPEVKAIFYPPVNARITKAEKEQQLQYVKTLEEKLEHFGIQGKVVATTVGPVVTLFEYQPRIDIPISKIIAREDDLALALQAMSVRIIAPIPGRSVIGFEVGHASRKTVYFSECITTDIFLKTSAKLPLVLGHTSSGEPVVVDLSAMPHLLVAGSTGSGKSVALHSMLISLICHTTPADMKFILIDPKRLEFAGYADIPHLLFPIVTEANQAAAVLSWAVKTMEERYKAMAAAGTKNIYEYRLQHADKMPFIVIVIDELADLMMVAGKEVEERIARLAQMARAAGIHLIVATQRPSVDVITGLIKVNFAARIGFKVISKVDSRTILDHSGAEKLLGKGDMLFLNQQGSIARLHGAYVTDHEIKAVIEHVKNQQKVVYESLDVANNEANDVSPEDQILYEEVLNFVKSVDEVSISLLQRKFRIGYNRSARLIESLELQGVILPSATGKVRKVLR